MKGQAADIIVDGVAPKEVAKYAESLGIQGIGLYETNKDGHFVHIDTRTKNKYFWYGQSEAPRSTFGGSTPAKKEEPKVEANSKMKYSENNKPLVCMQTNNMCYKNTREMEVLGVLWHSTGANNPTLKRYVQPLETDANYAEMMKILGDNPYNNDWNHDDREAGLNCWIGKLADGSVSTVQTMPWNYRPWGCGSGSNGSCNNGWIQFEICEDGLNDKAYFEAVYKEACEITAYLCKMFNLNPKGTVKVNGKDIPVILCHKDSYNLGMGNNHGDVLHWFPKFGKDMDDVRNDVAKLMGIEEDSKVEVTSQYKVGDEVKVKPGSTWYDGKVIADWVFSSKMYVRAINNNGTVVISTQKTGAITGSIYENCLEPYGAPVVEQKPAVTPAPSAPTSKYAVGDAVRVSADAKWVGGQAVASWVPKTKMYVREIHSNGDITISTVKSGAVSGTISPKYLSVYESSTPSKPTFVPYIVEVTAAALNVRAGAGSSYKVNTIVKAKERFTIVDEQNGFGKLKSGAGWIALQYTKKV